MVWHAPRVPDVDSSRIAIIGAGVSGLTCAVLFAERGYRPTIFACHSGQETTSAAAAAIWFPYDAEPSDQVALWSLQTLETLREISRDPSSGVATVELRVFARRGIIERPSWAPALGARQLEAAELKPGVFTSGYSVHVPVVDTTVYLDYLRERAHVAGATFSNSVTLGSLAEIDSRYGVVVNCSGAGARILVGDDDLQPHRGQIAVVGKLDLPYAVVCDDPPLMYAIPRRNDCVLGGTNDISGNAEADPGDTSRILAEAARVLDIAAPDVMQERVGLRPYRRSGVRLERQQLADGRTVIHNYGHGGSGFTLSWGCAEAVFALHHAKVPTSLP